MEQIAKAAPSPKTSPFFEIPEPWTDTEIKSADNDQFGFVDYAEVLARNLMSAHLPLTLGIVGSWGSGKTSIMNLIRIVLEERFSTKTLWVNVWQLSSRKEIWNALIQSLFIQIRDQLPLRRRLALNWYLFRQRIKWQPLIITLLTNSYRILLAIVPVLVSAFMGGQPRNDFLEVAFNPVIAGIVSAILAIWTVVKPAIDGIGDKISLDLDKVLKKAPYEQQISELAQLSGLFQTLVTFLVGKEGRLAIFIDDLDRCTPDEIPEILEGIKLFITSNRCVHVLSLDIDIVRQAIKAKYKFSQETEALEYLEKVIQLTFNLPPIERSRIADFIQNEYVVIYQHAPHVPRIFALGLEPNPRKIKRALNVYNALLALSRIRVRNWEMNPVNLELLAKIVVIQSRFPALYRYLEENPQFLRQLEQALFDKEIPKDMLAILVGNTPAASK